MVSASSFVVSSSSFVIAPVDFHRACLTMSNSSKQVVDWNTERTLELLETYHCVRLSSSAAGILGQLAKPFSTALFEGKRLNWRLIYTSGGMPSTHSASVTAAATALGMERGLSDSLFGMSVILACLVMYDAQILKPDAYITKRNIVVSFQSPTGKWIEPDRR